jgi:photosystem II stability/assembly factor-like uncharacterized protein
MKSIRIQHISIPTLLSLVVTLSILPGAAILAAEPTSTWSKAGTPSHTDLVVLPGSDIIDFVVAGPYGDTLYAIGLWYDECLAPDDYQYWSDGENVQNDRLVPRLWKSSDHGVTWKDLTSKAQSASGIPAGEQFVFFSAVAAAPDDPDFVVVAGYDDDFDSMIVGSTDGGDKFSGAGCGVIRGEVLCLAVSSGCDGVRQVAAGTKDLVNGGRVWRLEVGGFWLGHWVDTSDYEGWLGMPWLTGKSDIFAVTSLAFSPAFDYDETIVGVALGLCYDTALAASAAMPDPMGYGAGFYPAFYYFAGNWNGLNAWNGAADFPGFPGIFRAGPLLLYASTYFVGGWLPFFESPFLRMATDIALPYDFTGAYATDMAALVSVNGSLVPAAAGLPAMEGGFVFLMVTMAPAFELLGPENNPFVSSVAYRGSVKMLGDAMVGLAFPQGWTSSDIRDWYETGEPSLGCCQGVTVLYTDAPIGRDPCCPDNWGRAQKPPSGQFNAQVAFDRDGSHGYATTQGYSFRADSTLGCYRSDESAFSVSLDRGACWNQTGLIDTDIDYIVDVVMAGDCGDIVLATINRPEAGQCCDCDGVWRSRDGGKTWLRVWSGSLRGDYDNGAEWAVLSVPPTSDGEVVTIYMADLGTDILYYATSGGMCAWEANRTTVDSIADIAAPSHTTIYILDSDGRVAVSANNGRRWSDPVDSQAADDPGENAHSMVARGDWLLVGGDLGTVAHSRDAGKTFAILDDIGDGEVHLAFDSYFEDNGYVYAAVAGPDNGVYRTTVTEADFETMNACDYLDYYGIVVSSAEGNPRTGASTGGVLYAAYNRTYEYQTICPTNDCYNAWLPVGGADCEFSSGVARLLNPASEQCCGALDWDYLFYGLWSGAAFRNQPSALALCGCLSPTTNATIWAIDVNPYYDGWNGCYTEFDDGDIGRLWKFTDCFAKAGPSLIGIANGSTVPAGDCDDCGSAQIVLEWDRLCDACEYDIEIALDSGFKHKVWTTSTIDGAWAGAKIVTHLPCDGVIDCEPLRAYFKPSDPCAPSIVVPAGALDANTEYFWRVRARFAETNESYRSWWSETWSFNIAIGNSGAVKLTAPDDGATNVPRQNLVFTWTAVSGATGYEMTIWDSKGAEVASSTGTATSYVLTTALGYDSPYTWQVKAMKGNNVLSTSQVSTFRTMMQPTPPPTIPETVINFPEPAGTSSWVWVVIALAAILIIVVIVLIFRARRV